MFMILFSPLLGVMADDLGLSISGMDVYVTVANFCYGVGAIPVGWLGDRLGDKRLLVTFFAGCGLGGIDGWSKPICLAACDWSSHSGIGGQHLSSCGYRHDL